MSGYETTLDSEVAWISSWVGRYLGRFDYYCGFQLSAENLQVPN